MLMHKGGKDDDWIIFKSHLYLMIYNQSSSCSTGQTGETGQNTGSRPAQPDTRKRVFVHVCVGLSTELVLASVGVCVCVCVCLCVTSLFHLSLYTLVLSVAAAEDKVEVTNIHHLQLLLLKKQEKKKRTLACRNYIHTETVQATDGVSGFWSTTNQTTLFP